ncbi:hypothetical protein Tco_0272700 [Tanacetum coccineum]
MADSQSPEEGVKRIMSDNGETRPQKGSVVSFSFDNDHPTSAFVGVVSGSQFTGSTRQRKLPLRICYEHCFQNLGTKTKAKLKESKTPLVGFSGEWDRNNDNYERNPPRMSEDERSAGPLIGLVRRWNRCMKIHREGCQRRGRSGKALTRRKGEPV